MINEEDEEEEEEEKKTKTKATKIASMHREGSYFSMGARWWR